MKEERDWDAAWQEIANQKQGGFRSWQADAEQFLEPEEDEELPERFDPSQLPEAEPASRASQPERAAVFFLAAGAAALLVVLSLFEVLLFMRSTILIFVFASVICAALGVYYSAPWENKDDGRRL